MSISLDVHFLSSEGFSIKPPATIFDEIEGLFSPDKNFPPNVPFTPSETINSDFLRPQEPSSSLHDGKPCGMPSLANSDFLLNEEAHEDQQLFMVEPDGLKPITSPFMVPGIYKKIPRSSKIESDQPTDKVTSKNVFISSTEKFGKILAANVFREAYINLEEETVKPETALPAKEPDAAPQAQVADSLTMLAYDILKLSNRDNIVIDRQRNEIIRHEDELNRKTIYRFLTPKTLGLSQEMLASLINNESPREFLPPVKSKRGRPRKNKEPDKPPPPPPTPSRPQPPAIPVTSPVKVQRTRSGRIVKSVFEPPPPPEPEPDNVEPENAASFMRNFLRDLKDSEYVCKVSPESLPASPIRPKPRNITAESFCPTCNKMFLGKRMQQHFHLFPDHRPNVECQRIVEEMSLFKFLVSKVQRTSQDQRADVFLNEISDLVEQLQARSSRMIRNTSGLQFVNSKTSKVLGIPEGHYSLDLNAIDAPPDPIVHFENLAPPPAVPRLDYNLSISMDDTSTEAKLNLAGTIASEESLLRTVDDLMKEGMKKLDHDLLHPPQPQVIHYDHGSDNAVEAVSMKETSQGTPILDLSLDLFQFNSN